MKLSITNRYKSGTEGFHRWKTPRTAKIVINIEIQIKK
jgi:hypothetical protein